VVRERLEGEGMAGTLRIDFQQPPAPGTQFVHRTHPLVSVLADFLLETALDSAAVEADIGIDAVARAGAIFTTAVETRTTLLLVRLRHQLTVSHRGESRLLLCEETLTVGLEANNETTPLSEAVTSSLMGAEPARNMPQPLRDQHIQRALAQLPEFQPTLEAFARARAQQLLEDHRRVRAASDARGEYRVTPSLPVDIVGVFVLIPA
jgi:serine/threonine protein phosphatase PrpC